MIDVESKNKKNSNDVISIVLIQIYVYKPFYFCPNTISHCQMP